MKPSFLLALLLVFACIPHFSKAIDITGSIVSGGRTRSFVLHAPGGAVAQNLPVVFVFHGDGGTGAGIKSYTGFDAVADTANFMAVYPNADTEGWNRAVDLTKDVQFVSDMIDYFCQTYFINRKKIYATGHSAGGYMTYCLAVNLANKIAAFAPVAGNMYANSPSYSYSTYFASANYIPVPIYHVHGDPDPTVAYPDADHAPTPWNEWPLTQFSYYNCGKTTYTLPNATIATNVTKLNFCATTAANGKEISLIRVQGTGHGWPAVAGYHPASSIWNFCKNYSIATAPTCASVTPTVADSVIHTSGKNIISACDSVFLPKGINYSLLDDWDFPANMNNGNELSAQIIKANPNIVRIQWYNDYGQASRPAYSLAHLDSVVSRFRRAGIVSVLELHDVTGKNDAAEFQTRVINWWKSAPVLALLQKHKSHILLNIANEYGPISYPPPTYALDPNYATKVVAWAATMQDAIVQLRTAGIEVPIMIDACDYGHDMNSLLNNGVAWNNADPQHNIILSAHAYWDGQTAAQIDAKVLQAANSPVPYILGEVANVGNPCTSTILLADVLQSCKNRGIGWLAWTWYKDNCAARQLSTNGLFTSLSAYGQTVVNNASYGLAATAKKMDTSCGVVCATPTLPVLAATQTNICAGGSTTLSISGGSLNGAAQWQWYSSSCGGTLAGTGTSISVSPTVTTTYYARGVGGCATAGGCASITITVANSTLPSVSIAATPGNSVCTATKVVFTATPVNGGAAPVYQWKKNNANVGTNSATYTDSLLKNNDSVWAVLTSNAACISSSTATSAKIKMAVGPKVTPSVTTGQSPSGSICTGGKLTFTANPVNGGPSPFYQWKKNNNNVGGNSAVYTDSLLNNNDSVWVVMTSSHGCTYTPTATSSKRKIIVKVKPVANFTIANATQCLDGNLFQFTSTSTSANSYAWALGDGSTATTANTSRSYNVAGIYNVKLVAKNSNGCADSIVKPVTVVAKPSLGNDLVRSKCAGSLYNLTSLFTNSALTYSWNTSNPAAIEMGNYTVIASNPTGCKDTAVVTIANYPATTPVFTISNAAATSYTLTSTNTYGCKDTAIINIASIECPSPALVAGNQNLAAVSGKKLFSLQPNPASNQVLILGNHLRQLKITDSRGKLVLAKTAADGKFSGQTKIDLQGLAKGFYWVLLTDDAGNIQTEKLVVQ